MAKPKKKRTIEQTNKQKQTNEATTTKKEQKERDKKKYIVITGSAVVDFFEHIRDSAVIENMRASVSGCVIVKKTTTLLTTDFQ